MRGKVSIRYMVVIRRVIEGNKKVPLEREPRGLKCKDLYLEKTEQLKFVVTLVH